MHEARQPRRRRRHVLGEFLVVMLGVLAALILEQGVLDWQERSRLAATRATLDSEIADAASLFLVRAQVSPCIEKRLDEIESALAAASPPRLGDVGRPPYLFSSRGAWSGAAPELLSRHHGPELARTYGEVYQGIAEYNALSQREQELWTLLRTLAWAPEPDAAERLWRLREAVAGARNANLLLTAIAQQMNERVAALQGRLPAAVLDAATLPVCRPLAP
ncbi:hypothetical protein [Arenimonas composti]|uniref:Uncharacterized protein n=1 Tax=Arenimonas composti TR7-09 = DSM 18010 TaxID=1121013 RepID=A0A091BDC4_9GAMM|nr:hypothetical protein [Arenimonas composti]KFN48824.1 hypothetical protein P873_13510 [Arenimonas composti TR7-09 = DSM 18010]